MHESSKPLSENNPTHRPLASPPAPGVAVDPPPVDIGVFLRSLLFICLVLAFGAERRASRLRTGDVDAVGPWRRRRSRHDWFGWGRELAFEEESRDRIVSSASPELDCLFSLIHVFSKEQTIPLRVLFSFPLLSLRRWFRSRRRLRCEVGGGRPLKAFEFREADSPSLSFATSRRRRSSPFILPLLRFVSLTLFPLHFSSVTGHAPRDEGLAFR